MKNALLKIISFLLIVAILLVCFCSCNLDSRTIFKDANGNEFKLSVGNTWVMVADQDTDITYEVPAEE